MIQYILPQLPKLRFACFGKGAADGFGSEDCPGQCGAEGVGQGGVEGIGVELGTGDFSVGDGKAEVRHAEREALLDGIIEGGGFSHDPVKGGSAVTEGGDFGFVTGGEGQRFRRQTVNRSAY